LQNQWLKGVSTFVITNNGNLILEQRTLKTRITSGQMDLCSGHRDNKEKRKQTPYRELKEELGIKKPKILKLKRIKGEIPLVFKGDRKFFIQFYMAIMKKKNPKLKINREEVNNTIEIPLEEGFELIRQNRTKFPYEENEEKFEAIFQEVKEAYAKYKEAEKGEER